MIGDSFEDERFKLFDNRVKFVDLSFCELLIELDLMNVKIFSDPTLFLG